MVDHGILNSKIAVSGVDGLVIRRAVLARIGDLAVRHRLLGFVDVPAVLPGAGQCNTVQRIQCNELVHDTRGDQINAVQRLLQHHDICVQTVRHGRVFRNDQITCVVLHGNERIAAVIVIDRKTLGILQIHAVGRLHVAPRDRRLRLCGRLPSSSAAGQTAEQQCRTQAPCCNSSHFAAGAMDAESKRSVYSISCGSLIAVVSATTGIAQSKPATGISNVECSFSITASYFSSFTFM